MKRTKKILFLHFIKYKIVRQLHNYLFRLLEDSKPIVYQKKSIISYINPFIKNKKTLSIILFCFLNFGIVWAADELPPVNINGNIAQNKIATEISQTNDFIDYILENSSINTYQNVIQVLLSTFAGILLAFGYINKVLNKKENIMVVIKEAKFIIVLCLFFGIFPLFLAKIYDIMVNEAGSVSGAFYQEFAMMLIKGIAYYFKAEMADKVGSITIFGFSLGKALSPSMPSMIMYGAMILLYGITVVYYNAELLQQTFVRVYLFFLAPLVFLSALLSYALYGEEGKKSAIKLVDNYGRMIIISAVLFMNTVAVINMSFLAYDYMTKNWGGIITLAFDTVASFLGFDYFWKIPILIGMMLIMNKLLGTTRQLTYKVLNV